MLRKEISEWKVSSRAVSTCLAKFRLAFTVHCLLLSNPCDIPPRECMFGMRVWNACLECMFGMRITFITSMIHNLFKNWITFIFKL